MRWRAMAGKARSSGTKMSTSQRKLTRAISTALTLTVAVALLLGRPCCAKLGRPCCVDVPS